MDLKGWNCFRQHKPPGFLDGVDRTPDALTVPPLVSNGESALSLRPSTFAPTLFITNLPTSLFSSLSDLDGLLRPFGFIINMVFIPSTPNSGPPFASRTTSVLVSYTLFDSASEAKAYLDGEIYDGWELRADWAPSSQAHDRSVRHPTSEETYGSAPGLQRSFFFHPPIQYPHQLDSPQFLINSNYAHYPFAFPNNYQIPTGIGVPQDRVLPQPHPVLYS